MHLYKYWNLDEYVSNFYDLYIDTPSSQTSGRIVLIYQLSTAI